MARQPGPFPSSDLRRNVSDQIYTPNHTNDVSASAAGAIADTLTGFSRRLRAMADRAYTREGEADAAADIMAETGGGDPLALRPGRGVDDQAYNTVMRQRLLTQRQEAYLSGLSEVETANPDNLGGFATAVTAHDEAFRQKPMNDPALDGAMADFMTTQRGVAERRVRQGEERRRIDTARGAFVQAAEVGNTALGQAIASAGFDDTGAQLVAGSLTQYAGSLARFGPRDAFSVGGVEFAADPTRANALTAGQLAEVFNDAQKEARVSWISRAAEAAPDTASKRALIGQVQERWAAGDPAFLGLSSGDMDRLTNRLEGIADRAQADDAARMNAVAERARDLLTAGEYGDDVDMAELRQLATASGDPALIAQVEFAAVHGFEATPASLRAAMGGGEGGGAAWFGGWSDFLLEQLEGEGLVANDNGAGRSQWGITERSHPEAWRDGRVDRAEASSIVRSEYWDAIGGDGLDPELAFVAASAAVVGGSGTARELLAQAGGDPERFLQLEEARFRRLARENPGQYGDDLPGWLARQGKVRGGLSRMRAQRRSADGYASNPVDFARGTRTRGPLASVAEFDPASVFAGGEPARAWSTAIQQRYQTGRTLSQRDGVPVRILDNAEAAFYRDQIEADPGRIVPLAAAAATALGGDGARQLFSELGRAGTASADLHLAQLATQPESANIVRSILSGRQLRADGAKAPTFAETRDGTAATLENAIAGMGEAFATQPDLAIAVRTLAEDMAIGDAARGRLQSPGAYVNTALGATNSGGQRYGGAARVNGAVTIAPRWLRADSLDEALEVGAGLWADRNNGPVYANGAEIPARVLSSYRLRAMPNGNYQLLNPATGRPVVARSGGAFEFNIEAPSFRSYLARTRPGTVLGVGGNR